MPVALGPLSQQRREVPRVPRDEDPPLLGSEGQHLGIGERAEGGIAGEAEHVVTAPFERTADPLGRQVGVEQQPHSDSGDLDEGMEHPQLVERLAVLFDEPLDLFGIRVPVGERQADLGGGEVAVLGQRLR